VKFERLRIIGFKTFVDPTDVAIEPGLTGIVGPNGCGKSNLVEALRWVMGETSHKSMRASSMDDVIFSGTTGRPARNTAEVLLRVDNTERLAPAAFNSDDMLEISRKIERDGGSTYRINGREARARDVQLLFADAASGARSPSLVKQGQIGEIISAKPQARRRILEDAAGVAGLYSRRHEAELRLKASEDNLIRAEDVLQHLDGQIDGLKRQAKQALRYKEISGAIRAQEASQLRLAVFAARREISEARAAFDEDTKRVADAMAEQGEAARLQAIAEHELQPKREAEAMAGAALQRLVLAREQLDQDEERQKRRLAELIKRQEELIRDQDDEQRVAADASSALERLKHEETALGAEFAAMDGKKAAADAALKSAEIVLQQAEAAFAETQSAIATTTARRAAAERAAREAKDKLQRATQQKAGAEQQLQALIAASDTPIAALEALRVEVEQGLVRAATTEQALVAAEQILSEARQLENANRPKMAEAERNAQRLETEAKTIRKLLDGGITDLWPSVLDQISVTKGFEAALAAALGDDLSASVNTSAPVHWIEQARIEGAALPEGATALIDKVKSPPALHRALSQIGVVSRADLARMRIALLPGQILVTPEGDTARWDGFTAAADAPSAAARRLAERNRLSDIEAEAAAAIDKRDTHRKQMDQAQRALRDASQAESDARNAAREARRMADGLRDRLQRDERALSEQTNRLAAKRDALALLSASLEELQQASIASEAELSGLPAASPLDQQLISERAAMMFARNAVAECRAACQNLHNEAALIVNRRKAIAEDMAAWRQRNVHSSERLEEIKTRMASAETERAAMERTPDDAIIRRRALSFEIEQAEAKRKDAADLRAMAETAFVETDRLAKDMLRKLGEARESRARSEAMFEAANTKQESVTASAAETMGVTLDALDDVLAAQGGENDDIEGVEQSLAELRRERERMGPVNLRADEELNEIDASRTRLITEREELTSAIRKLRRGIETLNSEGRERLIAAFDVVNGHFKRLFATLFNGGEADLTLIESDDPLEAGLEIIAKPPGKKPQVLTLLSGGEQALTAIALIFAVFLTNPSPICVLDEIDAPLDDANVERLCTMLDDMVKETQTRFVTITHNPITMARMDRLFGVTMAEKGVSQLVSVDLTRAAALAEVG
jgi:chromosome segregation protein